MCIRPFVTNVAFCCLWGLALLAGCAALDQAMDSVGAAGRDAREAARDPNAPLPDDARIIFEGLGVAALGATALYHRFRHAKLKTVAKAVVAGVEDADATAAEPVKAKIKSRMEKVGRFDRLNAVVDELKAS